MNTIFTSRLGSVYLAYCYVRLLVQDNIDYYFTYLILSLPIRIKQAVNDNESSDSDSDGSAELVDYDVFITEFMLVFYDENTYAHHRVLNGCQLRPLIDENGKFFVQNISRYYPTLDTIILRYIKFPIAKSYLENSMSDSEEHDGSIHPSTLVIDVKKKYDLRNLKSCKMGVVL